MCDVVGLFSIDAIVKAGNSFSIKISQAGEEAFNAHALAHGLGQLLNTVLEIKLTLDE